MPPIQFAIDGTLLVVLSAVTYVLWGLNSRLERLEAQAKAIPPSCNDIVMRRPCGCAITTNAVWSCEECRPKVPSR